MTEQLVFDLPIRQALGRDAFFVSPSNSIALATLDTTDLWPSRKLILMGPCGSGKTHMAHVWAAENNALIVKGTELGQANIAELAAQKAVVVEDADRICLHPDAAENEHALFHLHNLILAEAGTLLVTATTPPSQWKTKLPDLASRMQGTSLAKIDAPDDALLSAMLLKQFDDRQIAVSPNVIPYLLTRMERSAAHVRGLVERLDATALTRGKPISRALAAHVFEQDTDQTHEF